MGNQQTTSQREQPSDQKTPNDTAKIHPQASKSPAQKLQPMGTPQQKMKPSNLSFDSSMASISQVSKLKLRRNNSIDNTEIINKFEDEELLSPQEIDNIYFYSQSNIDTFFDNLQEPLSKLYMTLAKHAMTLMNTKLSQTDREAKLFLCEKILNTNLNIMKTLGQKKKHEFDQSVFKKFNDLQRSIIGYLKAKYPKGQQNFVSGDLMNAFRSFDYVESPQNDILRQAGVYFNHSNIRDLMKKVKGFLNSLIDQVDVNFPRFQRILQQRIFKTSKSAEKSLEYKINRRLPENITKFISINSNSLDIISPELFGVVLKWIEDIEQFILNPDEEVDSKETLKVINEEDDSKYFTDQINTQDNYFVIKELKQKLNDQKQNYQRELNRLIENMYKFQHNLIKIIQQADLSQRYVPRKDAEIIKFAAYNTKFMSWMLAEKLTIAMKILVDVGRHFKNTMIMMPLDLIKFNVTDILRATLKGSKSELLQVYDNLKKLETEDQIKIIRLDNQLGTALNGIVINFKMKKCFLICEVSLILSESSHNSNQKVKNIEKLNNFFTDIQNSPYGVFSELAEYVGYKDSKIGYENKVNFVSKQLGIPICEVRHSMKIETIKQQYEPFVCTSCSRFYGRLENTFIMKKCTQCNNFLCCKCIFSKSPSVELNYLKEEIIKYLNDQISYAVENTRGKVEGSVQGITGNTIFQKSFEKIISIKDIQKERKLKKMNRTQFEVYIGELKLKNFIYGSYEKGEITLISLNYNENLKELSFGLDKNEDFYSSKRIGYNSNDFLIIYDDQIAFSDIQSGFLQKAPFINIFSKDRKIQKGKYQIYKINEINMMIGLKGQKKEQKLIIDGVQVIGQGESGLSVKKDFKFGSLKNYLEFYGLVQTGRKSIKLQQLGIQKSHLSEMISLPWVKEITELNISKNKITSVNEILKHLPNLERFSASENYIKEIKFQILLPKLTSLVVRKNLLKSIINTANIPNIEKINLQENRFQTFPILNLKQLRHLNLGFNYYLNDLEFLSKSTLPQLIYINLQNSMQNIQYHGQDLQTRSITVPFNQLKCFILDKLMVKTLKFSSQSLQRLNLTHSVVKEISAQLKNLQYLYAEYCKIQNIGFLFNKNNQNHTIKEIDLSFNVIKQLPVSIKSKTLQKLYIQGNMIKEISSLANSQLPSLKLLDISHNQIEILPKLSFPNLTEFKMYGNPFKDIDEFAKSEFFFIQSLEFSSDYSIKSWPKFQMPNLKDFTLPSVVQQASLEQFEASQMPKIQNLHFQSVNLSKFPLLNFPSLESLRVYYCTIQNMDTLLQCKLPNLKKLQLSYINYQDLQQDQQKKKQKLKRFKIDIPNNLDKLEQINASTCQFVNIQTLISKPFKNIITITIQYSNLLIVPKMNYPSLKFIYFNGNKITDIVNFCDSQIPQIQDIDLSGNQITMLKKLNFKSLMNFNISSNALQKMDNIDLPSLNRIDFSFNKLTQFPIIWSERLNEMVFDGNPFKNLNNLQRCHIPKIKSMTFSEIELQENSRICPNLNFPTIQTLSLYSMNFTEINKISNLLKLQSLSISYCSKIAEFPCLVLPELKNLYVTNSEFGSWKGFWQSQIQNLNSLDIYWSNVESMKGIKLPNLVDLNIHQNEKLTSVEEFFSLNKFVHLRNVLFLGNKNLVINHEINLPSLKKLQITFSPLNSTKIIGNSEQLTDLRICEANLNDLNFKELRRLQNLDLLTNQIKSIDSFCLKQWRFIKILCLSENKITQIPKMTTFPLLQILNLDFNEIQNVKDLMQNSQLLSLVTLYLSHNRIKAINQIKNFPKLYQLYLDFNEIESVQFLSKVQNVNPLIYSVSINNNKIKKVSSVLKIGVQSLQLRSNLIQSIQWLNKSQLPRIQYVDLSSNRIKKLTTLNKLNQLNTLTFVGNPVEAYDQLLFKEKLPVSFSYITLSSTKEQSVIDKDCEKFTSLYANVHLSVTPYQEQQHT